jgi:hypothetical protein
MFDLDLSDHPTILDLRARLGERDLYRDALYAVVATPADAVTIARAALGLEPFPRDTVPVDYAAETLPDASALVVAAAEEPAS